MVRATVQARRVQRLQQLRNQDAAYSAQLAVESKRSRHAAEDAAMASLGQEFEAERAARELQLQEQYNTAMAGIGQGHALAREAEAHIVARASEQYWSFVRAQQAEQHRSQAAREEAKNARQHREAPRTDLLKRLHRVKEVEQDRAAAAAAAAATRQPPAAMEVVERDPTHTPSTATHLHAVRTPVVVREAGAANATAFEAARAESEKAAAARRKDADAEAARIKAAADRGKEALARMKSDQLREQVKQRLLDAQRDVEARERDLAMRAAAMQAKNALARVRISPTLDGWDDLASAKSDNGSTHSEQSKHQVDDQFDSQPESHQPEEGYQADPSSSPDRHSADYREYLRIRARALQTEQEQLERSAELSSRHAGAQPMAPSASIAGSTDESAADAVRQTARTTQRIGELDLALDRLLHRLAPSSSDGVRAESSIHSDDSDTAENLSVAPAPWLKQPSTAVEPTRDAVAVSAKIVHGATGLPGHQGVPAVDNVVDESGRFYRHQSAAVHHGCIDEVESALSHSQQRYDTMTSAAGRSLTTRGADGINSCGCSDTLSCSSLSSESMHGADSTQSFVAQSDLSDDDSHC